MRNEHELQKAVLDQLDFDPAVTSSQIGVAVHSGVVTLTGHVPSFGDRVRAVSVAGLVKGVKGVVDELEVELPGRCATPDEIVAQRAYERLASNQHIPVDRIHLSVREGIVTLRGDVDWEFQRSAALYDLQQLNCVKGVRNEIKIRPPVEAALVSDRIRDALERLGLNSRSIVVEANGSAVALSGCVNSWQEKRLAETAAWALPGVSNVDNRITVN